MPNGEIWTWVYPDGTELTEADHMVAMAFGRAAELAAAHGGAPASRRVPGDPQVRVAGLRMTA